MFRWQNLITHSFVRELFDNSLVMKSLLLRLMYFFLSDRMSINNFRTKTEKYIWIFFQKFIFFFSLSLSTTNVFLSDCVFLNDRIRSMHLAFRFLKQVGQVIKLAISHYWYFTPLCVTFTEKINVAVLL